MQLIWNLIHSFGSIYLGSLMQAHYTIWRRCQVIMIPVMLTLHLEPCPSTPRGSHHQIWGGLQRSFVRIYDPRTSSIQCWWWTQWYEYLIIDETNTARLIFQFHCILINVFTIPHILSERHKTIIESTFLPSLQCQIQIVLPILHLLQEFNLKV